MAGLLHQVLLWALCSVAWSKETDLEDHIDCFVPGSCDRGTFLRASFEATSEDCRASCGLEGDCKWFTFYGKRANATDDGFLCSLFVDCESLAEEEGSFSGKKSCRLPNSFCWRSVRCLGQVVGYELNVNSSEGCFDHCNSSSPCRYFTHDPDSHICTLMSTCPSYKSGCHGHCTSGQASCSKQSKQDNGLSKLLVSLGDISTGGRLSKGLVVDLSGKRLRCNDIPKYPHSVKNAVGGFLNDKIIFCGGKQSGSITRAECYQLEEGEWKGLPGMGRPRKFSASSVVKASNNLDLLYVHGGTTDLGGIEDHGSIVYDEASRQWNVTAAGDPFPLVSRHCMVVVDNTTLMTIGGWIGSSIEYSIETWFHDLETRDWFAGPPLRFGRNNHACGVMSRANYHGSGKTLTTVVVAGGVTAIDGGGPTDTTEFLHIPEDFKRTKPFLSWQIGPILQNALSGGRIVEGSNRDKLYLVGGRDHNYVPTDKIYQLTFDFLDDFSNGPVQLNPGSKDHPIKYAWIEMEEKIPVGIADHVAFFIPDEAASCRPL